MFIDVSAFGVEVLLSEFVDSTPIPLLHFRTFVSLRGEERNVVPMVLVGDRDDDVQLLELTPHGRCVYCAEEAEDGSGFVEGEEKHVLEEVENQLQPFGVIDRCFLSGGN